MVLRSGHAQDLARAVAVLSLLIAGCRDTLGISQGTLYDAAAAADTDAASPTDAAPWTPARLSELVLWLDGSDVADESKMELDSMGRIVRWFDRSGNGNDARPYDPKTLTPKRDPGVFPNGKDALLFADKFGGNASFVVVWDVPALRFGQSDFTVAMVMRSSNTPAGQDEWGGYAQLFCKPDGKWPYIGVNLSANVPVGSFPYFFAGVKSAADPMPPPGVTSTVVINDGKFHRLVARRTGASMMSQWLDRNFMSMPGIDTVSVSNASDLHIGGYHLAGTDPGTVNAPLYGDIAEVIAVKGTVSDEDALRIDDYFVDKYGF